MFRLRAAFLVVTALPLGARAQGTERFSLRGNDVAVYNVAGRVTIERGDGNAVVVEVTRGGGDSRQLKVEQRTVDGREALCVIYPRERIIYRQPGQRGNSSSSTTENDCRTTGGGAGWFSRNRIEVASSGRGVEAWADIRIVVPVGRDVRVKHMVGKVDVDGVDATLRLDVSSGSVSSRDTRGMLYVDAGSGGTNVSGHRGDLTVDVGSGGVSVPTMITVKGLRKDEAQEVYRVCQAREQSWREKRRIRELEEMRAKAGGIQFGGAGGGISGYSPNDSNGQSPTSRLQRAKEMLESGLLTDSEFEQVKAKILAEL